MDLFTHYSAYSKFDRLGIVTAQFYHYVNTQPKAELQSTARSINSLMRGNVLFSDFLTIGDEKKEIIKEKTKACILKLEILINQL